MIISVGELSAFGTAISWSVSNQINSAVACRIGATNLTLLRLPVMLLFMGALCLVLGVGTRISLTAFLQLALSGVLGLTVGDFLLYRSILIIGPTMAVLVLSLSAGIAAIFGWLFMGESLPMLAVLGIAVALAGVGVVVTEHSGSILLPGQAIPRGKTLALGVTLAGLAAASLALAYVVQRAAMLTGVQPLWATFVRVGMGGGILWAVGSMLGWASAATRSLVEQRPVKWLLLVSGSCGALGMWLMSTALVDTPSGVVATIIGLQPITVAAIGAVWYRRRPSLRIVFGSLVAFIGVALVCLH